ncbi:unnamed protein product [Porites lobata]|uniref:Uncharacterized protein n=1 Tax=Porites lobata TaxID=104759 RepID=A0ABN8S1N1_9CNID|nr:unnamed protein product [Porites lobata]
MGRREQENRKRKATPKSLNTWVSKVPRQPSDADNDSAVCDDSPAETTTSDLSQLTTVLQRDVEDKIIPIFAMSTSLDPIISLFLDMKQTRLIIKKPVREHKDAPQSTQRAVNVKGLKLFWMRW